MAVISPQPQRLELQAYAILPGPHIRPLKKKKKTAKNISTQMSVDSEAVCCKSCLRHTAASVPQNRAVLKAHYGL